jgi:hypothetical protein
MRNTTSSAVGAASGSFNGSWFYIGNMTKATIMAVASDAGSSGAVTVEVSNDASPGGPQMPFTPSVYVALASPSVTVSGTTVAVSSPFDICYQWMRLVYTRSAGSTGVVTANFAAHD